MRVERLKINDTYCYIHPVRSFQSDRPNEYAVTVCQYCQFSEKEQRYVFSTGRYGSLHLTKESVEMEVKQDKIYFEINHSRPHKKGTQEDSATNLVDGQQIGATYVYVWEQDGKEVGVAGIFRGKTKDRKYLFLTKRMGSFYLLTKKEVSKHITTQFNGAIIEN